MKLRSHFQSKHKIFSEFYRVLCFSINLWKNIGSCSCFYSNMCSYFNQKEGEPMTVVAFATLSTVLHATSGQQHPDDPMPDAHLSVKLFLAYQEFRSFQLVAKAGCNFETDQPACLSVNASCPRA